MNSSLTHVVRCLALALSAVCFACGSESDKKDGDQTLELYSWWTNPGETDALAKLLDIYKNKYSGVKVIEAAVTGNENAREQLETRMVNGMPPDTFQALGGWDLLRWVLYNGEESQSKMEPIDSLAQQNHWAKAIPKSILDAVSYNGKMYGVPIGVHRYNVLYYNKKVLDESGLEPPTTWAEFYEVSEALEAKGIVPLALGNKLGWPTALIAWDGILIAQAGVKFHDSYLTGKQRADDPKIVAMLKEMAKVLGYTNKNRDKLTWDEAAQMVVDGDAAMTIMGDWAKGFLLSKGLKPNVDFGQVPIPGTKGVFVYLVDSFGLPKGAQHREVTLNFLELVGSLEVQDQFNPIKGSTPPRTDADASLYDVLAKETIKDFQTGTLSMGREVIVSSPEFNKEFVDTMQQFASDSDVDTVVNMLKNRYDLLQSLD